MPPMAQMNQLSWGWPLPLGPKVYSRNAAVTTSQYTTLMAVRSSRVALLWRVESPSSSSFSVAP